MYLKSDAANCDGPDVRIAALSEEIDRLGEELRDHRNKLHDVELFQSVIKGLLFAAGATVFVLLMVKILTTSASDPPAKEIPKAGASQQADAARSAPQ